MKASAAKRLKELEGENLRPERLPGDAELDKDMLREVASGNFLPRTASEQQWRCCSPGSGCQNDERVAPSG
jgi:hypothetical protein